MSVLTARLARRLLPLTKLYSPMFCHAPEWQYQIVFREFDTQVLEAFFL